MYNISDPAAPLTRMLRDAIATHGPMPFEQFMALALYHPHHGYYERPNTYIGRQGDFFTNVAVGPLFGQLLAARLAAWLQALPAGPVCLVEAGAHDGRLAADLLGWLARERPMLLDRLTYWLLEPSATRRQRQRLNLAPWAERLRWATDWPDLGPRRVRGAVFSNELLDAFPVRRLGWDASQHRWFEWGVAWEGGRFAWARLPQARQIPSPGLSDSPGSSATVTDPADARAAPSAVHLTDPSLGGRVAPELQAVMPDGFTVELCPQAARWWFEAARRLEMGWLLTIDYGHPPGAFLAPQRPEGTVRAYAGHRLAPDPLARPGEQDLTAHVDFEAIERAGAQAGLRTAGSVSQDRFLVETARDVWPGAAGLARWSASERRQFQTLTHPEHLGRRFQALIQTRL